MKVVFHGGAREVGRSCIEIQTQGDRYLMDAGIKFLEDGFAYPEGIFKLHELDGIFLSHAHLDHSGALPLFEHYNLLCPIICTSQTKVISKVLLRDSYKVARIRNLHPAYSKEDITGVWNSMRLVNFNKKYKLGKVDYELFNAGHIPGSACTLLEAEGKSILYTGDFNTRESRLMKPAETTYPNDIDLLICESTYGDKDLPERKGIEEKFKQSIRDTIAQGGRVLIPVFALGRSQEVLLMLAKEDFGVPMYFDGMCNQLTRRILSNPSKFVKDKELLAEAYFNKVHIVGSQRKRQMIAKEPGIFITTSGMLQGGPVMSYLKEMWGDEKSAVLLMGFQVKGTNGRHLMEDGYVFMDGWRTFVKCKIEKYDFSGHLSRDDIKTFVQNVKPKKLAFVHGDPESVDNLTQWASKETDCEVFGPRIGDEIVL
ncbi:MBL fold metallo-hydrolase [Nanoarchaeota archaeon]